MGEAERGKTPPAESGRRTLGDVLYATPTAPQVSENEWVGLVQAIARGDERALHTIYERTHRLVFTLTMRIVGNRETAEELTLDVFHDVWRRAGTYDPAGGSVVGWIMNQARCRAIDRYRFDRRQKRLAPADHQPAEAPVGDPAEALDAIRQGRVLHEALRALTSDERLAIETAFFSGLSHREVADSLRQPLGTVKTRIRSGLRKLRQEFSGADR